MPKRKNPALTAEQQSARFNAEVQRLIDAGELDPTEADATLDALVRKAREKPQKSADS